MGQTRQSILIRAQIGEAGAWDEFIVLYRPLIAGWLVYHSIPSREVDDLVQEILMTVVKNLPKFAHSGRGGAFRSWLRAIASREIGDFWRGRGRRVRPAGDVDGEAMLARLEDDRGRLEEIWDSEHDRYILKCLLDALEPEFGARTIRIFRRLALDDAPAAEVAAEFETSVGAAYVAKSRVLRRLREEAQGLIDGL